MAARRSTRVLPSLRRTKSPSVSPPSQAVTASGTSSSVSKQQRPMAGPIAAQRSPGFTPRAPSCRSASPRMSPTELRQPQCTAAAAFPSFSHSRTGTQSAVKQKSGRPFVAVATPSAS